MGEAVRGFRDADAIDAEARRARLQQRIGRIAWLTANAYGVAPAELRSKPRFKPNATLARMVAVAVARDVLLAPLPALAAFFGEDEAVMAAAANRTAERCAHDADFRTTVDFLKQSCEAALAVGD